MQACPRCKTQIPENAKMCVACGTRLDPRATAKPAQTSGEPAKTAFGLPSPVKPAQPVTAQPVAPPQGGAAKTMFGVGLTAVPPSGNPPVQTTPQQAPQAPEAKVPPKTAFGVGVVTPTAQPPSSQIPGGQVGAPQVTLPSPQAEQAPVVPQSPPPAQQAPLPPAVEPRAAVPSPVAPPPQVPSPAEQATLAAPEGLIPPAGAIVASDTNESTILGSPLEPEELPGALPAPIADIPPAPSGAGGAPVYFLKILKGRVERQVSTRKLENENQKLEAQKTFLLASLGFRALKAGFTSPQIGSLIEQAQKNEARIQEISKQQMEFAGEQGNQIKAFEAREAQLKQELQEKEQAFQALNQQLKDVEAERKRLQAEVDAAKKQGQTSPPAAQKLAENEPVYQDLKTRTETAKQAVQGAKTTLSSTTKEKKKALTDLEARLKTTGKELETARDEVRAPLAKIGQEALTQSFQPQLSQGVQTQLQSLDTEIQARQSRIQSYEAQAGSIDAAKFKLGAMITGGGVLFLFLVIIVLKLVL